MYTRVAHPYSKTYSFKLEMSWWKISCRLLEFFHCATVNFFPAIQWQIFLQFNCKFSFNSMANFPAIICIFVSCNSKADFPAIRWQIFLQFEGRLSYNQNLQLLTEDPIKRFAKCTLWPFEGSASKKSIFLLDCVLWAEKRCLQFKKSSLNEARLFSLFFFLFNGSDLGRLFFSLTFEFLLPRFFVCWLEKSKKSLLMLEFLFVATCS